MEEIKEGDVVEVKIPSATGEVTVVACVIKILWNQVADETYELDYIMYAQNRLFRMHGVWQHIYGWDWDENGRYDYDDIRIDSPCYKEVIADYVIIPDVDLKLLEYEQSRNN